MSGSRGRLVTVVVLLVISIPLVLVAVLSGSAAEDELTLERTAQGLIVYLKDGTLNQPSTANGRRDVTLECLDESGSVAFRRRTPWPLPDTDGGGQPSHAHQAIPPQQLGVIARCRLAGTDGPLEGEVAAR